MKAMRYDVTIALHDHKGQPIKQNEKDTKAATLRDVLEFICITPNDELKTSGDKVQVYRILQKNMAAAPILEISAEDVALLKRMIGAMYPAVLVGVLFDVLEAPKGD